MEIKLCKLLVTLLPISMAISYETDLQKSSLLIKEKVTNLKRDYVSYLSLGLASTCLLLVV